jgi:hypothetical protein
MRKGVHGVGRRCLQRIVANGGNRLFIKGGKVKVPIAAPHLTPLQKAVLLAAVLTPKPPELQRWESDGAPTQEAQFKATADAARARRKKGASDDV